MRGSVSLPEIRDLWTAEDKEDAIVRAAYLAFDIMPDIMALVPERETERIAVDNIAKKAQMIVNLLSPYADRDDAPEEFRKRVQALFGDATATGE